MISDAQREIDAELATDVLIIEDEAVIAADIEALVREMGHSVIGIATTRSEAAETVARARPGLVLADIHLADGSSGIDAVKDTLEYIDVPVIFITAFPERLLTGQRPEPTFLITKPFQPETVKASIGQALVLPHAKDVEPRRRKIASQCLTCSARRSTLQRSVDGPRILARPRHAGSGGARPRSHRRLNQSGEDR